MLEISSMVSKSMKGEYKEWTQKLAILLIAYWHSQIGDKQMSIIRYENKYILTP